MRIQQLGVSPATFWNGSSFGNTSTFLDANLDSEGTSWTLPNVSLDNIGSYRIRVIAIDNAGNVSQASQNPQTVFSVK